MSRLTLTALALSPVHVGDGTTWTPEAFRLDGDDLVRFEPAAVVAGLDDAGREAFLAALDRDRDGMRGLQQAQQLLRDACGREHERERIAVSPASRGEIGHALRDPGRSGRVHPFVRTGGAPFLPGSSLKGALRTALLSARVADDLPRHRAWLDDERIEGGASGQQSRTLQERVLGETDTDPFRFVRVEDASLPAQATRMERVVNLKRGGKADRDDKGRQMHFECLRPGIRFAIRLDVRDRDGVLADAVRAAEAAGTSGKAPRRAVDAGELLRAVDAFYRGRWRAEMARFFPSAWSAEPPAPGADGFPVLVRVGRFAHFESASVDGLRRGWQPQARRTVEEGSTRAVVREGERHVPFGWLLLVPEGGEGVLDGLVPMPDREEPTPAPPERGGRHGTAAPPPARGLVGRRGRVDGDPVEVVADTGDGLTVRFLDTGDVEPVGRDEFEAEE